MLHSPKGRYTSRRRLRRKVDKKADASGGAGHRLTYYESRNVMRVAHHVSGVVVEVDCLQYGLYGCINGGLVDRRRTNVRGRRGIGSFDGRPAAFDVHDVVEAA